GLAGTGSPPPGTGPRGLALAPGLGGGLLRLGDRCLLGITEPDPKVPEQVVLLGIRCGSLGALTRDRPRLFRSPASVASLADRPDGSALGLALPAGGVAHVSSP